MSSKLMYDCHIHYYGDEADKLRSLVETSDYASKYMCYHSINYSMIKEERNIDPNVLYFMVPFVIKELDISSANRRLGEFTDAYSNIMQIPLLGDDLDNYKMFKRLIGFKEHFLLHDMADAAKRATYYEYLDKHGKILLLHCKDAGRIEYIDELHRKYPNMYIQIAHLGVNRKNIEETKPLFARFADDGHIYYDVSTVYDFDFIAENYPLIQQQILYGTDCPYVANESAERQAEYFENNVWLAEQMNLNAEKLLKTLHCSVQPNWRR